MRSGDSARVVVASTTYLERYWARVYMVGARMRKQEGRGRLARKSGYLIRDGARKCI